MNCQEEIRKSPNFKNQFKMNKILSLNLKNILKLN